MGRARQPARRDLRARRGPQRARFRRPRRRARADASRAEPSTCRAAAASDWLADPNDYVFPTYLTVLDRADRAERRGARSTGSARRWEVCSACSWRRNRTPRSRGSSSTTSDLRSSRPALERIRGYFGMDPTFATLRRDREIRAHDLRAVRAADRRAVGASYAYRTSGSAPTAVGAWPTIRESPCRFARRRRRPTCGPSGMRFVARRSCCAARESDLLSAATVAQMAARGPRPAVVEFAGVGHAPMLLASDQIDPVVRFLRG